MEKEFIQLKNFLDSKGVSYVIKEHEPVFTSEEAAKARDVEMRSGVKSMVFAAEADRSSFGTSSSLEFIIALVPSNKKVDVKKLST